MKRPFDRIKNIFRVPVFGLALLAASINTGCEDKFEIDIPLAVNDREIQLPASGGNTNVVVWATGDWTLRFEEQIDWGSLDRLEENKNNQFRFTYAQNYGTKRMATVIIRSGSLTDTVRMIQSGLTPSLNFPSKSLSIDKKAQELSIPLTQNLGTDLSKVEVNLYPPDLVHGNWITGYELRENELLIFATENDSGEERNYNVELSFRDVEGTTYMTYAAVKQLPYEAFYPTFGEVRELIPGASGEMVITEYMVIEGVIITEGGHPNVDTPYQTLNGAPDKTKNNIAAYIQSADGAYGFRIHMTDAASNTFERYSTVEINLQGATLTKEADPGRYTISNLGLGNIISRGTALASNVVEKSKYISDLTDEDIYTYVTLKDVEFGDNDNIYTNYNNTAGWQTRIVMVPISLFDIYGSSMFMLTNLDTPWRSNQCPRGSGDISGILVHDKYMRCGPGDGDIGRYSLRVMEEEEIKVSADESTRWTETLVEWNFNTALNKQDNRTLLPEIGNGILYPTSPAITNFTHGGSYKPVGATNQVNGSALSGMARWWNFTEDRGEGFEAKFSTSGIDSDLLMLILKMESGSGSATTMHMASRWHVQYSFDGISYSTAPGSDFVMRPLPLWGSVYDWMWPGGNEAAISLPASLLGQAEVYLRVIPSSKVVCVHGSNIPETGVYDEGDASQNAGVNIRLDTFSLRYKK